MNLRLLKAVITLAALAAILVRVIWPDLRVDAVTLGLLLLALLPWLSPLIKSAEFPGGWKINFQDLKEAADKVTSRVTTTPAIATGPLKVTGYAPSVMISESDPNLALVGVRIELEKRLRALAERNDIDPDQSVSRLAGSLHQRGVLDDRELAGLRELIEAGNRAAHGAPVSPDVRDWVRSYANEVLEALDGKRPG